MQGEVYWWWCGPVRPPSLPAAVPALHPSRLAVGSTDGAAASCWCPRSSLAPRLPSSWAGAWVGMSPLWRPRVLPLISVCWLLVLCWFFWCWCAVWRVPALWPTVKFRRCRWPGQWGWWTPLISVGSLFPSLPGLGGSKADCRLPDSQMMSKSPVAVLVLSDLGGSYTMIPPSPKAVQVSDILATKAPCV